MEVVVREPSRRRERHEQRRPLGLEDDVLSLDCDREPGIGDGEVLVGLEERDVGIRLGVVGFEGGSNEQRLRADLLDGLRQGEGRDRPAGVGGELYGLLADPAGARPRDRRP